MKEHRNRFSVFSLLHIYTRLSGKTDHVTDVQMRKAQTKSITAPSREIHYSQCFSVLLVFYPRQAVQLAKASRCDLSPTHKLTVPLLHVSSGTSRQGSFTYGVLNYIQLGQEGTLWIFSCNYQSCLESDLLWLSANHQLSGIYISRGGGKGSLENKGETGSGFCKHSVIQSHLCCELNGKSKNLGSGM